MPAVDPHQPTGHHSHAAPSVDPDPRRTWHWTTSVQRGASAYQPTQLFLGEVAPANQQSTRFTGGMSYQERLDQLKQDKQRRYAKNRRRSRIVASSIAALLAGGGVYALAQSDDDTDPAENPDYAAVCGDPATGQRVDDQVCDANGATYTSSGNYSGSGSNPFFWYFIGRSQAVPPVGSALPAHASTTLPSNATIRSGFNRQGGLVQRGGFGAAGTRGFVGTGSKSDYHAGKGGAKSSSPRGGFKGPVGG